ncbi:LytR/AlgR family response regulator transcription factor [Salinivirga cyanobacteriivorans]
MKSLIKRQFPQNFILRNPFLGSLLIAAFCFIFVALYQPLRTHASGEFKYTETMAIYMVFVALGIWAIMGILKQFNYFREEQKWNLTKEILLILFVLTGIGIIIYFAAFLIEPPANRWNFATFFDSMFNAFLIGIVPLSFFTLINIGYLKPETIHIASDKKQPADKEAQKITIESQLKKESLEFYPSAFLYAESDGNYVVFYLLKENKVVKHTIRNSISAIEEQVASVPELFRSHRAFIVNLKKIVAKRGNSSGYQLKLSGINNEIPVSRKKAPTFKKLIEKHKG